jgi:DNA-binding beta-propeller fold protein YncE
LGALLLAVCAVLISCRDKDRCTSCSGALEPPLGIAFSVPNGDVHYFQLSPLTSVALGKLPGWAITIASVSENGQYLAVANDAIYHHVALLGLPEMNVLNETMIGGTPVDIEVNASGMQVYIATNNASFWAYSPSSGTFDTLELMLHPRRFALRPPEKNEAWVVCGAGNSIQVISLTQFTQIDTITLPKVPTDIQFSPNGQVYYVAMRGDTGELAMFSSASQQLIQSQPIGRGAFELAISDDGRYAAMTDSAEGKIHVWDTAVGSVWSLSVGGYPYRLHFARNSHWLYVLLRNQSRIIRISITENGLIEDDAITAPQTALEFILWETP